MNRRRIPIFQAFCDDGQLAILAACFFVGMVSGCLLAIFSCGNAGLESYLTDYLKVSATNGLNVSLVAAFWSCFRWPLLAWLFIFTAIGVVMIPALMLVRGFVLAYATACFGILYGYDGLWISAALFAGTALLELPAIFALYCEFFRCSQSCITVGSVSDRSVLRAEVLLVGAGILVLASALQATVIPGFFVAVCQRIFT